MSITPVWTGPLAFSGTVPAPRGGHSTCVVGKKLFVFGGSAYSSKGSSSGGTKESPLTIVKSDLHVLDLPTLTWSVPTVQGIPPSARYAHTATLISTKIFVFGGFNGRTYLEDLVVLDVLTMTWYAPPVKGTPPSPRYAHTATQVGQKLFVFGGCGENRCFSELYVLDTATMTWFQPNATGTVPPARAYHTTTLIGRKLFVFGGRAGNKYYNDLYILSLDGMIWTKGITTGPVPGELAYHASVAMESRLYIFGGMDGLRCYSHLWVLHTESMNWVQHKFENSGPNSVVCPSPRHKHTMSIHGCQIFVFGGMEAPPTGFNDVYMLETQPGVESVLPDNISVVPHPNQANGIEKGTANNGTGTASAAGNTSPVGVGASSVLTSPTLTGTSIGVLTEDDFHTHNTHSYGNGGNNHANALLEEEVRKLQIECSKLREDLSQCYLKIDQLCGKNLTGVSMQELDMLEKSYLEGIRRVALARRDRIQNEYERKMQQQREDLEAKIIHIEQREQQTATQLQARVFVLEQDLERERKRSNGERRVSIQSDGPIQSIQNPPPLSPMNMGIIGERRQSIQEISNLSLVSPSLKSVSMGVIGEGRRRTSVVRLEGEDDDMNFGGMGMGNMGINNLNSSLNNINTMNSLNSSMNNMNPMNSLNNSMNNLNTNPNNSNAPQANTTPNPSNSPTSTVGTINKVNGALEGGGINFPSPINNPTPTNLTLNLGPSLGFNSNVSAPPPGLEDDSFRTFAPEMQGEITKLQSENLKLRRRLKDSGIDLMEGVQKSGVGFSVVKVREFVPQQGLGVPSMGAAPIGIGFGQPAHDDVQEDLEGYERRRENERKGVQRIPEDVRKQMLMDAGVPESTIDEDTRQLNMINWGRMESVASPTDNPLPEHQRMLYRKFLYQ
eukprot:TRINITY_DN195_c1_g1_i1.p1 TRINITY_DN195_c1_g1~~TRINITY_DN195_c1_g1_i1.p1  ORF type:complete len:897 (+),score=204.07 TRINITY_DN195_c1_g1_i1:314-3004(+)